MPLVALDDLVSRAEVRPPEIIKMDIEGSEYDALVGAKKVLTSQHPQIFLSGHTALRSTGNVLAYYRRWGTMLHLCTGLWNPQTR